MGKRLGLKVSGRYSEVYYNTRKRLGLKVSGRYSDVAALKVRLYLFSVFSFYSTNKVMKDIYIYLIITRSLYTISNCNLIERLNEPF